MLAGGAPCSFLPIKGLERLFSLPSESCIYRIADSFLIRFEEGLVSRELLLRHGKEAVVRVAQRHPRMRATVVEDGVGSTGTPLPPYFAIQSKESFACNSAALEKMWGVVENSSKDPRCWEIAVHREINAPARRSELPLWKFILVLNADTTGSLAHLIVVADHCVADGFSTSRAAHDFFTFLTAIAAEKASEENGGTSLSAASPPAPLPPPLEPLPPAMDLMRGKVANSYFTKALLSFAGKPLVSVAAFLAKKALRDYPSVLPLREEIASLKIQEPLPFSPTAALFATGNPQNTAASKARCKEEGVTLHGALIASIMSGYSRVALREEKRGWFRGKTNSDDDGGRVSLSMVVDFNLRKRLTPSLGDDHVGLLIGAGLLESLAGPNGVYLTDKFWDVARKAKQATDKMISSTATWLAPSVYDRVFRSVPDLISFLGDGSSKQGSGSGGGSGSSWGRGGVLGDCNVSNIGVYPFPTTHTFYLPSASASATTTTEASKPAIKILSHHLLNGNSVVSDNAIWFFSSVDGVAGYSMVYKSEHDITSRIFADVVNVAENLGTIGKDETLKEVVERLCPYGAKPSLSGGPLPPPPPYNSVYANVVMSER
jgi:Alcohol acetyltransferase